MKNECLELSTTISKKTQAIHCTIRASNKLTAVMENAQASASKLGSSDPNVKLKLLSKSRWNSLEAMLSNHLKTVPFIKAVMDDNPKFDLDEETTTNAFVRKIE